MESRIAPNPLAGAPSALIRTLDGRITYWSPEMEHRYGFAPQEAVGQVAHKLLRTTSWQTLGEIETILIAENSWRGGLIHYRADDQPVIASHHWRLNQAEGRTRLVTELHSDLVPAGTTAASDLADVIAAISHQLSEPLTAIGAYMSAARRALEPAWPDRLQSSQAIDRAIRQLARVRETLNRMRALGTKLRDRGQVEIHTMLTETMEQIERTVRGSCAAVVDAVVTREKSEQVRERLRHAKLDERALERMATLKNIQLIQHLLEQDGFSKLDARIKQMMSQLLIEETAKLEVFGRR
jgi:signal transduction histidine kinase